MTCWAVLKQALAEAHRVTVVALSYPADPLTRSAEAQEVVRASGASLDLVEVPQDVAARPEIFPTVRLGPAMHAALERIEPDALFVYHWDTLAATRGAGVPQFAAVDDLWHLPNLRRWQQAPPKPTPSYVRWTLDTLRSIRPAARAMVDLLNGCEDAGAFQAKTAAWLRAKGASRCDYLAAPIVDPLQDASLERPRNERVRILLGPSQLGATSTAAGLRLFGREVLPALDSVLAPEEYEVHVVGPGNPPPELAERLPHPAVVMRGWADGDREFRASDIQLAPTPFVLGKRVRIIAGFAYGICVVAHAAEAVNLPELRDDENALLGGSGSEIAEALARAVGDQGLRRRLGENARRTYEERFHPGVAARALVERLERLAGYVSH
jgi:hypothetical protein